MDFWCTSGLVVKAVLAVVAWVLMLGIPYVVLRIGTTVYQDSRMFGEPKLIALRDACVSMVTLPFLILWVVVATLFDWR